MNSLSKIRRTPVNTREMFDWGMISYKTYKKVELMSFADAKQYCDNVGLYQTWSHSKEHVIAHFEANNIQTDCDRMEFIKKVMIVTDGQINPNVAQEVWKHFNLGA